MIALRIATTGLDPITDEIVGICIVDEFENVLMNTLIRPINHSTWDTDFCKVLPESVFGAIYPTWNEVIPYVQDIINRADGVILYNSYFMKSFMPQIQFNYYVDLMTIYAIVNGEMIEIEGAAPEYKMKKLWHACQRFGIDISNLELKIPYDGSRALMRCYKEASKFYGKYIQHVFPKAS